MFSFFKKKAKSPQSKNPSRGATVNRALPYTSSKLVEDLSSMNISNNAQLLATLPDLIGKSRRLHMTSSYLQKYILSAQRNVVGSKGALLQSLALKSDGSADNKARKRIEEHWSDFCKGKHCDLNKKLTMTKILHLLVQSSIVDGAFLALKVYGVGKYGYSLQLLPATSLDTGYNVSKLDNGNKIVGAIEFTPVGTVVAYHLLSNDDSYDYSTSTGKYTRYLADRVIYTFLPKFIGQTHGLVETVSAIPTLHAIEKIEEAALVAARHGAESMGFIINKQQGEQQFLGDREEEDGTQVLETEAGIIRELAFGKEYVAHDPKYPHEQLGELMSQQLRKLATGWGMSYADLTDDLRSVNLSSFRGSTQEARETWKNWQEHVNEVLSEVFTDWLEYAILTGKIEKLSPLSIERYNKHSFHSRTWYKVDPVKDEKAIGSQIANKRTSVRKTILNDGNDPDKIFEELEKEAEFFAKIDRIRNGEAEHVKGK